MKKRSHHPTPLARRARSTRKAPTEPSRSGAERRALDALAGMRHGKSLSKAARSARTTPDTVRKYAGRGIVQLPEGRYAPLAYDTIRRPLKFLAPDGVVAVTVRSSASASRIAEYWNAVNRYLRTGRTDALRPFRGEHIRSGRKLHRFVTDPSTLDRLGNAGEVRFEDLYGLTS
jgi:hypothetical protein